MRRRMGEPTDTSVYQEKSNDLVPISQLSNWKIAEGFDIRGWSVVDQDDDDVGKISDVVIDRNTGEAVFAAIDQGKLMGLTSRSTLIPIGMLQLDERNQQALCDLTADDISNAPGFKSDTTDFSMFHNYWSGITPASEREADLQQEQLRQEQQPPEEGQQQGPVQKVIHRVEDRFQQRRGTERREDVDTPTEMQHGQVEQPRLRIAGQPTGIEGREQEGEEQVIEAPREGERVVIENKPRFVIRKESVDEDIDNQERNR